MMEKNDEITTKVSKSGKNLIAHIPIKHAHKIGRGDKVKIIILEKNQFKTDESLKKEISDFIEHPNGEKLVGSIIGYPVVIPLSKFIRHIPKDVIENIVHEAILN